MPNGTRVDELWAGDDVQSAAGIRDTRMRNVGLDSGAGLDWGGTALLRLLQWCSGRGQALTQGNECESFCG